MEVFARAKDRLKDQAQGGHAQRRYARACTRLGHYYYESGDMRRARRFFLAGGPAFDGVTLARLGMTVLPPVVRTALRAGRRATVNRADS